MSNQSAQPVRFERVRRWLARPLLNQVARQFFRLGQVSMANKNPFYRARQTEEVQPLPVPAISLISGIAGGQHLDGPVGSWAGYIHHELAQEPKPVHLAPETRKELFSVLETLPAKPEPVAHYTDAVGREESGEHLDTLPPERFLQALEPMPEWPPQRHTDAIARLPIENGSTPLSPWHREEQHTGAFLLDNRDALFEDVRVLSGPLDDEEQTVARQEPGLYQIQMMARAKQKESE